MPYLICDTLSGIRVHLFIFSHFFFFSFFPFIATHLFGRFFIGFAVSAANVSFIIYRRHCYGSSGVLGGFFSPV